jgi:hypothetical protein
MSIANRKPVYLKQTTIDALTLAALASKRFAGGIGQGEYRHAVVDPKTGESTYCPICLIGHARFLDGKEMNYTPDEKGPVETELRLAFEKAERADVEGENDRAVCHFLTAKAGDWYARGKITGVNFGALPWRARGVMMPTLMRLLNIKVKPA